jgi:hypothetical protein
LPHSRAAQVGVPSSVRSALLPGLYALLDCCSKHEAQQLHALLDG